MNTDQGSSQFTSLAAMKDQDIWIGMDNRGSWWDSIFAERPGGRSNIKTVTGEPMIPFQRRGKD